MEHHMPPEFAYREVFLKGRPQHDEFDRFYSKHPPMPPKRWAKIFSPFDALRGFDFAVASKEIEYVEKKNLEEETQTALNEKIQLLHELTQNSRIARKNMVQAAITYYTPCTDIHNESYKNQGRYITYTGTVWNVDTEQTQTLRVDDVIIPLDDIYEIDIHLDSKIK